MNAPTQAPADDLSGAPPELGPDLTGTTLLGRYAVLRKLGAGGMGTVYVAEHTTIGKKSAIKVLGADFAKRPELVERFLREARAASMIPQQNVVEITDFGETDHGSPFFVMEYLEGEDLRHMLEREEWVPWDRARHLVIQICRALEAAHDKGIIHRDMKPDNCFRLTRGQDQDFIKVLDFGIAKIQGPEEDGKGLTQTGMLFGTPAYMSPEQAQGARVDHRTDIYALGVILYQLLSGHKPFVGETFMAVLTKHMFETPVAPSELTPAADIPPEAEAIVLKAMQKDPAYRFQSMAEMIEAIEAVGTGAPPVSVVAEDLAQPGGGRTDFSTKSGGVFKPRPTPAPATKLETVPDLGPAPAADEARGQPRRAGLWVGLGGVLAAAAILGYMLFGNQGQAEAPTGDDAVVAPGPRGEPEPEPELIPEPAVAAVATVAFETNVPARVLDARDRAIYGSTAAEGGVELPMSSDPMSLLLVAEGHEELAIDVVPDRASKRYAFELVPLTEQDAEAEAEDAPAETGKRKRKSGGGSKLSASAPADDSDDSDDSEADKPKAAGPKLPSKGGSDGEIKNPFMN